MNPRWKTALPIVAAGVIAALTLVPMGGSPPAQGFAIQIDAWRGFADVLANVALFLPLGIAFGIAARSMLPSLVACAACSFAIEVIQLAVPGRYSSLSDLVFNTMGAAAGLMLVRSRAHWLAPRGRTGVVLSTAALLIALIAAIGGGFLLQPDIHRDSVLFGQWTPPHPHMTPYRGRVLSARTGSIRLPSRRIRRSAELRAAILAGDSIVVRFAAGPPVAGLSPIFTVYNDEQNEMLLLAIAGDDAVVRVRARSHDLALDQADFRFPGAFAGITEGDTVTATVWRQGAATCLDTAGASACHPAHSPGWSWALLMYPGRLSASAKLALVLIWLTTLFLPAGFWLRTATGAMSAAFASGIAILFFPRLLWGGPMMVWEAVAAAAGVGGGVLLRHALDRRGGRAQTADTL